MKASGAPTSGEDFIVAAGRHGAQDKHGGWIDFADVLAKQVDFFIRHHGRENGIGAAIAVFLGEALEFGVGGSQGFFKGDPRRRAELHFGRLGQAVFRAHGFVGIAGVIADPPLVHVRVKARFDAVNHAFVVLEIDVLAS